MVSSARRPDYFELSKIVQGLQGLNIYLEEKNIRPIEYRDQKLESKGFLPEIYIQDFPIRNQKGQCGKTNVMVEIEGI